LILELVTFANLLMPIYQSESLDKKRASSIHLIFSHLGSNGRIRIFV